MSRKTLYYRKRKLKALVGFSIIFLILGLANILIGRAGVAEYSELVLSAEMEPKPVASEEETLTVDPYLPQSSVDIARKKSRINHIKTRLDFYRIVVAGGKFFLAISALIALWAFLPGQAAKFKATGESSNAG